MHKSCFFYSLRLRNSKVKSKFEFQIILDKKNWKIEITMQNVNNSQVVSPPRAFCSTISWLLRNSAVRWGYSAPIIISVLLSQIKTVFGLNKKKWTIWTVFASFYFYIFLFYTGNIFSLNVHKFTYKLWKSERRISNERRC